MERATLDHPPPVREIIFPFADLPNLDVTALTLGYLGYEDEIKELMYSLSKKSKKYFKA